MRLSYWLGKNHYQFSMVIFNFTESRLESTVNGKPNKITFPRSSGLLGSLVRDNALGEYSKGTQYFLFYLLSLGYFSLQWCAESVCSQISPLSLLKACLCWWKILSLQNEVWKLGEDLRGSPWKSSIMTLDSYPPLTS